MILQYILRYSVMEIYFLYVFMDYINFRQKKPLREKEVKTLRGTSKGGR